MPDLSNRIDSSLVQVELASHISALDQTSAGLYLFQPGRAVAVTQICSGVFTLQLNFLKTTLPYGITLYFSHYGPHEQSMVVLNSYHLFDLIGCTHFEEVC